MAIVDPSRDDPVVTASSEVIGGPMGRLARRGVTWWTPVRVLLAICAIAYIVGYLLDMSCRGSGWVTPPNYEHLCYSDIPPLYSLRGLIDGQIPYLDVTAGQRPLEYPVLTGVFMYVAGLITTAVVAVFPQLDATRTFFDINVLGLFIPLAIAVVTLALTVRRRPWDAAMLALSPCVILAATINWDLLPLGFVGLSLLLWSRRYPTWAGVFLGLAVAAKFYPVLFLGPFLLLALRSGRWRACGNLVVGAAVAWLVVNVPVMLANFDGWVEFYRFSSLRGQDFGSLWFGLDQMGWTTIPSDALNRLATGVLVALCVGIAIVALTAPRRPRLASLLFLVIAAFTITNKVYSPQYVLWLVPLAIMARPRWRDLLIWQAGEIAYFVAVWWFLVGYGGQDAKGLIQQWYAAAIFVHIGVTVWFSFMVIRDIYRPAHDPIRSDGFADDSDDPAGGPFDHAPDAWSFSRA